MLIWSRKVIWGITIILVVGYFGVSYILSRTDNSHPLIGQKAPDLTFEKADGSDVKLSSIAKDKKAIVVDFWASWCGPCRRALPALEKLAREYDSNQVLFIAINVWENKSKEIDDFLTENDIKTMNILFEKDKETSQKYFFNGIPAIFVLDGDMKVHNFYSGYSSRTDAKIKSSINELIR